MRPKRRATKTQTRTPPVRTNGDTESALWESLRQGARNVAGVTYQVAVTAHLLVAGRVRTPDVPHVIEVIPEGFEDIDCLVDGNARLFVQAKERAKSLTSSDIASAIAHAARALVDENGTVRGQFAIVTDAEFTGGFAATGWSATLGDALRGADSSTPEPSASRLRASVIEKLKAAGMDTSAADALLDATHLIRLPWHLAQETEAALRQELNAAVATLAYSGLIRDVALIASENRAASRETAGRRTQADLDALVSSLLEVVDPAALGEAFNLGLLEPVDYRTPSPLSPREFFAGVDAGPAHIVANLDVIRPASLIPVLEGLTSRGDVVIAGPSGGGKSALMWRAAREVGRGARILRVLRCSTVEDGNAIVRHVRLQDPSDAAPVLVCVDDLGRDSFASWLDARDRLQRLPGVKLLVTVRKDHFTARVASSAVIVEPVVTEDDATAIYQRYSAASIDPALEIEEARDRANGLLMEFIALSTKGQRIRQVLRSQLESLRSRNRTLEIRLLMLVTAAHVLGSAISADDLAGALASEASELEVGSALGALADEHLLRPAGDGLWRGLHDLRSEVLFDLLHESPPPTPGRTLASVLGLLAPDRQPEAIRRAAARIAAGVTLSDDDPVDALSTLADAADPLVRALSKLVTEASSAAGVAGLLEGAVRADAALYAAACLPFLRRCCPPTLDVATLNSLAYSMRNDGLEMATLPVVAELSDKLPGRATLIHGAGADALADDRLVALATSCSTSDAVALLESLEGARDVSAVHLKQVWQHHIADSPADFDVPAFDRQAQLAASIVFLSGVPRSEVPSLLGPITDRAHRALVCLPWGLSVAVVSRPDPSDDNSATLVIEAAAMLDPEPGETAYPLVPQSANSEPPHRQAVNLAQRLSDFCAEADRVEVSMLQANLRPAHVGPADSGHDVGVVRLERGALARRTTTRANVANQAAVARLLASDSWSWRLRCQAELARDLTATLQALPARLKAADSIARQREFLQDSEDLASKAAALPREPTDQTLARRALSIGEADEQAREEDAAKESLSYLASTIHQAARALSTNEPSLLAGAAARFGDFVPKIEAARERGAPLMAGIGDTLPAALDKLAQRASDLIRARRVSAAASRLFDNTPFGSLEGGVTAAIELAARELEAQDREVVASYLISCGIDSELHIAPDPGQPSARLGRSQVIAFVPLEKWVDAVASLQSWPAQDRGLVGAATAIAILDGTALRLGMRTLASVGAALPVIDDQAIEAICASLGVPVKPRHPLQQLLQDTVKSLELASTHRVVMMHRNASWPAPSPVVMTPNALAARLRDEYSSELVDAAQTTDLTPGQVVSGLIELCELVDSESGSQGGLAASSASLDVTSLASSDDAYINITSAIGAALLLLPT